MSQYGGRTVWRVRQVVASIARRFDDLPQIWMEGEVTNLSPQRGANVYFTLVDSDHSEETQIDCVMQANVIARQAPGLANGALVQVYGRVEFWRRSSQVRMRATLVEPAGEGLLLRQIAELRRTLAAEGLTSPQRKRPLPMLPRRVGIVTAHDSAARHDLVTNIRRRFPSASLVIVSSRVQGDGAVDQIVRAVRYLDAIDDVDVIVVARGGGALEDLMAFNSERVCRAVAGSRTPIVSAVGHESDVTVCDDVADVRASTPTQAAERVVPDYAALVTHLDTLHERAMNSLRSRADQRRGRLEIMVRGLRSGLQERGLRAVHRLNLLDARMAPAMHRVQVSSERAATHGGEQLVRAVNNRISRAADRIERANALMSALSPRRTVERGYAIVRTEQDRVVEDAARVTAGGTLHVEMRDGTVTVDVTAIDVREDA